MNIASRRFPTIMTISRQQETLLLFRMTSRVLYSAYDRYSSLVPSGYKPHEWTIGAGRVSGAGSRYVNSFATLRNLASYLNFHMRVALLLNYINYVTKCTNIYRIHVNMCDVMIVFNIS